MAVRSTRSSLNIRQKLSELDRPVGIIGDALMATNTPQDAYDILQCGRRNMIINGDMRIAQRGTSAAGISSSIPYLIDRFCFAVNTGGTWLYTQSSNAPSGFNNSARFEVTSANSSLSSTSYVIPQYVFEGNDLQRLAWGTTSAKPLTLSFWCRSNKPGIYHVEFQIQGSKEISKRYTINTPDVWEYKTVTFEPNYQYSITATNAYGGNFYWWLAAGTVYNNPGNTLHSVWGDGTTDRCPGNVNLADIVGNYFEITGVQCEIGNTATPFEYRYYGEELSLCQRYFQLLPTGLWWNRTATATVYSSAYLDSCNFLLPTPMRATPTGRRLSDGALFIASTSFNTSLASIATRNVRPVVYSFTNGIVQGLLLYDQSDNNSTTLPTAEVLGVTTEVASFNAEL